MATYRNSKGELVDENGRRIQSNATPPATSSGNSRNRGKTRVERNRSSGPTRVERRRERRADRNVGKNDNEQLTGAGTKKKYDRGYSGGTTDPETGYYDPDHAYGRKGRESIRTGVGNRYANLNPQAVVDRHFAMAGLPQRGAPSAFGQFLGDESSRLLSSFDTAKTENLDLTIDRFMRGIGGNITDPKAAMRGATGAPPVPAGPKAGLPRNRTGVPMTDFRGGGNRVKGAKNTATSKIPKNTGTVNPNFGEYMKRAFLMQSPFARGTNANLFGGGSTAWAAY